MKLTDHHRLLPVLLLLAATAGLRCDESLPTYEDPTDLFEARVWAFYNISLTDNSVKVYLSVVNRYDETLDEKALLQGTLVIFRERDPGFRRTVAINAGNLQHARNYNPETRVLRIDPGDSIRLGISWDLSSDDGRSLTEILHYSRDPLCRERFLSEPETIVVNGELTLFEHVVTAVASGPKYTFQHHRQYVDPRLCTPL